MAVKLPIIIKKILNDEQITRIDKYNLSIFMTMLWLRSAKMREQINDFHEQMYKKINSLNAEAIVQVGTEQTKIEITDKQKNDIKNMLQDGDYDLSFNNAGHLQFLIESLGADGEPGFSNALANKYWKIYVNKTKIPFITSDAPVSEWQKPPSTFYNIEGSFLSKEHFFALTPEIFIEMTYPHVIDNWKVKKKTLFPGDEDIVMMYNIVTASKAHEEAYSSETSVFEEMIRDFSTAKSRFGRMYLERFEFPWIAYKRKVGGVKQW